MKQVTVGVKIKWGDFPALYQMAEQMKGTLIKRVAGEFSKDPGFKGDVVIRFQAEVPEKTGLTLPT